MKSMEALKEMCAYAAADSEEFDKMMRATNENEPSTAAVSISYSNVADSSAGVADIRPAGCPSTYSLPDGTQIIVSTEGCCAVEALLRPKAAALAGQGSQSADSAMLQDQQQDQQATSNKAAVGGCGRGSTNREAEALLPGLPETVISCVETGYEGTLLV
jgi:hypothetical protein